MEEKAYIKALQEDIEASLINDHLCLIRNHSSGTKYYVKLGKNSVITTCTCPHYQYRRVPCKHMIAAHLQLRLPIKK